MVGTCLVEMRILSEMTRKYHEIDEDAEFDSRVPLHSIDDFEKGIRFKAKLIGTLDVPRPTTRLEIVASMRRIRYEYKARSIKKKKIAMTVSIDGVQVVQKKKKRKRKTAYLKTDERETMIHEYPIYRIFYVTHDSQDMKIFSYIVRDGQSNVFKCSVFKASKVNQALRIVRTIGQAFDVCHQLDDPESGDPDLEASQDPLLLTLLPYSSSERLHVPPLTMPPGQPSGAAGSGGETDLFSSPLADPLGSTSALSADPAAPAPLSFHHEWQLVQEQLKQQKKLTKAALEQVRQLRDQLESEAAARLQAQARTHQVLQQNRRLLAHVRALAAQLQTEEEAELAALASSSSSGTSAATSVDDIRAASDSSIEAALSRMNGALQVLNRGAWAIDAVADVDADADDGVDLDAVAGGDVSVVVDGLVSARTESSVRTNSQVKDELLETGM